MQDPREGSGSRSSSPAADRDDGDVEGSAPADGDGILGPEDMTLSDRLVAASARPDLPDEAPDGLDDMDEEIRREAEDLPIDTPGRE